MILILRQGLLVVVDEGTKRGCRPYKMRIYNRAPLVLSIFSRPRIKQTRVDHVFNMRRVPQTRQKTGFIHVIIYIHEHTMGFLWISTTVQLTLKVAVSLQR